MVIDRFERLSGPVKGALLMTGASFGFTIMNVLIREASVELHPTQIAFFRNLFAALFMLPLLHSVGFAALRTERLGLHVVRALIGIVAMTMWFTSVTVLPLAEAVSLNFTVPLFAVAGAAIFLKEVVGIRRWSATLLGFLGVLVILRPGFQELHLDMAYPIVAAFCMAISVLIVKSLSRTDSTVTIVLLMNLLLTPLSFVIALPQWVWPSAYVLMLVAGVGAVAVLAHLALTRAYTYADASAILPFDYTRLPFIALLGYLLYGEVPDGWIWAGAGIIAGATIYIAHREATIARSRQTIQAAADAPKERP